MEALLGAGALVGLAQQGKVLLRLGGTQGWRGLSEGMINGGQGAVVLAPGQGAGPALGVRAPPPSQIFGSRPAARDPSGPSQPRGAARHARRCTRARNACAHLHQAAAELQGAVGELGQRVGARLAAGRRKGDDARVALAGDGVHVGVVSGQHLQETLEALLGL